MRSKNRKILEGAKEAYKFKEMKENALLSLPVLVYNRCKIILDQYKISATKQGK